MDDKIKIVLGNEDIIAKGLDDIFINVNLQHTFNQIKKDKYDNNFDLAEQFKKERNQSRNFRIYGIVDSNIINTDNFLIEIYKDSGLTQFHSSIITSPLVYEEKNIFSNKRGKYLLELNNYDSDYVYMKINGDYIKYDDQVFEQQLVFYTVDGEFVEYGTKTVDIGLINQGFTIIDNDFKFFYNKHWIKKNIEIVETKKTIINFTKEESTTNEGDSTNITISLNKQSPFGNETVDLDYQLITAKESDFYLSISGTPINFPLTLNWSIGEQYKVLKFNGLNDDFPEFTESVLFKLKNFNFVDSGETITHSANINDITPRNYANYNFCELYRNRYSFTGRTFALNQSLANTSSFSILRNGLKYERRNEEFYPNDTYNLSIINKGGDTVLPINTSIRVLQEELFLSGETKTYNLSTQYNGTQVQKIKVIFSGSGINSTSSNSGFINLNGTEFLSNNPINYNSAKLYFTTKNPLTLKNLETPWDFEFDDTKKTIIITSKSVGVPIDFSTHETNGPNNNSVDQSKIPIVEEINEFKFYEQIPLEIRLASNSNLNNNCLYEFVISKPGYGGVVIQATSIQASSSVLDNFLITGLDLNMRDWDSNLQSCTFITGTTVDGINSSVHTFLQTGNPNTANFIMPIGSSYINGSVLYSSNTLKGKQINESNYLSAAFYPKKLLIKPCTDEPIINFAISQITKLTLPGIGQGNVTMQQLHQANSSSKRSFDFRTGTTGAYTTFTHNNNSFSQSQDWKWGSNVIVNNGTYGGVNSQMSNILDFGNTPVTQIGPVNGQDSNGNQAFAGSQEIYLKSKIPGVPFEITNISNAVVLTSASSQLYPNLFVTAGDVLGPITTEIIVPNTVVGGQNPARNFMGGFNPILQFVP